MFCLSSAHQAVCSFTGVSTFLELWEATPFSVFQHVTAAAGPCRQHREACGGVGEDGEEQLPAAERSPFRAGIAGLKNLHMCYELPWHAEERRVNEHHPGPENNPTARAAGWRPATERPRKSTAVSQGWLGLSPASLRCTRLCHAHLCQWPAGHYKEKRPVPSRKKKKIQHFSCLFRF